MLKFAASRRLILIAAAGLLVVLLGSSKLIGVNDALGVLTSPLSGALHNLGSGISGNFGVVGSAQNLAKDNADLRKENANLRAALASATASASELAAIKKELGLRQVAGKKLIPADVISTQPDSYRAFITINRGSADGLAPGMVVIVDGTLIGTVSQVGTLTAKVLMVTDPTFRVTGEVLGSGGATGTVYGAIGGGLVMEKIPQDQTIHINDSVITSGLGSGIIRGYSLGVIKSITRADNGVFQSAMLATPVQISRLKTVFVVGN